MYDLKSIKDFKYKFFLLCFIYLILFYFTIFKNLIELSNISENIEQAEINLKRIALEKNRMLEALKEKNEKLNQLENEINLIFNKNESKDSFTNFSQLFSYIDSLLKKYNLTLLSYARKQENENNIAITITFRGKEISIIEFLKNIENSNYYLDFSKSYFKMYIDNNNLIVKSTLNTKFLNEANSQKILKYENNSIFAEIENEKHLRGKLRIGERVYYKNYKENQNKDDNSNKETKTKKKTKN